MCGHTALRDLTEELAEVIPDVDSETTGQYGDGLGSEDEERQLDLLLDRLRKQDARYQGIEREAAYPERSGKCDFVLTDGTPVEAKLIRYWRANGNPEPTMYSHVFSPFHRNTLMTDARRIHASKFAEQVGCSDCFTLETERTKDSGGALRAVHTRGHRREGRS